MSSDPINPSHYTHLPAEAIDIIEAAIARAPSNQSAYLQGQVLKYLLRCWSKKGIEDLRKAKWYLDRMVASFDEVLAEESGAGETPIDEPVDDLEQDNPPHDFKVGDSVISWQGKEGVIEAIGLIDDFPITVRHSMREQVYYKIGGVRKKHDDYPVEPTPWTPKIGERVIYTPSGSLWTVDRELKEKPRDGVTYILKDGTFTLRACVSRLAPCDETKYREPTQADLANGPIKCEVRDRDSEDWQKRWLVFVSKYGLPFRTINRDDRDRSGEWNQCRIEVAE